jgi:hypothetical protein
MTNGVFEFKQDADGPNGVKFKRGDTIQLDRGLIYMQGYPLSPQFQEPVRNWLNDNKNLLTDVSWRFS